MLKINFDLNQLLVPKKVEFQQSTMLETLNFKKFAKSFHNLQLL